MSRIHEALQKADLDRKLQRARRNARVSGDASKRVVGRTSVAEYAPLPNEFHDDQVNGSTSTQDEAPANVDDFFTSVSAEHDSRPGSVEPTVVFEKFLHRFLSKHRTDSNKGLSLAITSVNAGEGVTCVTKGLADALHDMSVQRVLRVNERNLARAPRPSIITAGPIEPASAERMNQGPIEDLEDYHDSTSASWGDSLNSRRGILWELCSESDVLLIDCPPLRVTRGALPVASLVDGVVLVVQAGSTTKQDVMFAERAIIEAGGSFEGFILNEAQTPIPSWLSKLFSPR